jgi:hypothetical protein
MASRGVYDMYSCRVTQIRVLGGGMVVGYQVNVGISSVQYMPNGILKPKKYKKYNDRQNN